MKNILNNYISTITNERTKVSYTKDLSLLVSFLEKEKTAYFSNETLKLFLIETKHSETFSSSSYNRICSSIKSFLKYTNSLSITSINTALINEYRFKQDPKQEYVDVSTVLNMISILPRVSTSGDMHAAMIGILLETGIKKQSLLDLKVSQVVNNHGIYTLTLENGNTYNLSLNTSVNLGNYLNHMTFNFRHKYKNDYLFQMKTLRSDCDDNKQLNPKTINEILTNASLHIGLTKAITPSNIRNTYLSILKNKSLLEGEKIQLSNMASKKAYVSTQRRLALDNSKKISTKLRKREDILQEHLNYNL